MPIYFIGINLDSPTAHYRTERGYLTQIMRGIYADSTEDLNTIILQHAVRIAKYFPKEDYL